MRRRIAALAVVALLLGGCTGPEDGADGQVAETPTQTRTTPSPVTETPQTEPAEQQSPSPAETSSPSPSPTATPTEVEWSVTEVVTGLRVPWSLAFAPDGTGFFTQRDTGVVNRLTQDGTVEQVDQLDVDSTGEGGLLGLTVSPDYGEDGLLYAYFTSAEDNRVVRFAPGEEREVVIDGIPKAPNHNGGRIAFGPDGMLYIGTGDAGRAEGAQDPESLGGKILRLTPDGTVPGDNPFDGSPVWSLGHRNVQGFDWDAEERMYATEFGPDQDDEINLIEAGGNYGWPEVTGEAGTEEFIDPILVLQPAEASWSGSVVLTDSAIPQWDGDLFAASLRGRRLWRIELDNGEVTGTEALLQDEYGRLRLAVQGPDGALWLSTSDRDGRGTPQDDDDRILRIAPSE